MKIRRKTLMYATIFLGLFIAGGEFISRYILGLGTPPLSVAHPTIEYLFKPNQNVYRFGNHFVTNNYGMRSDDFGLHKQKEEIRILIFGDSVVNGGNLTDQQELATEIIKKKLEEKINDKIITVGNVSAGSWGPGNWLAYVKQYGFFDADYIVLVTNSEDYQDNPAFQALNPNTHPTRMPGSALMEAVERYLPRYLPSVQGKKEQSNEIKEDPNNQKIVRDNGQGIRDLTKFLELAKQDNKKVIVIQHLKKTEILTNQWESGYDAVNQVCKNLNISCVSLQKKLEQSLNNGIDPYRNQDDIHINSFGQGILAEVILRSLFPEQFR